MRSIVRAIASTARRFASKVLGLLPGPPPEEAPPPDIDGHRPSEADTTQAKVNLQRKDGKGGYR
jgi:hypothetical protein